MGEVRSEPFPVENSKLSNSLSEVTKIGTGLPSQSSLENKKKIKKITVSLGHSPSLKNAGSAHALINYIIKPGAYNYSSMCKNVHNYTQNRGCKQIACTRENDKLTYMYFIIP